jgi:phage-related minor tail protein
VSVDLFLVWVLFYCGKVADYLRGDETDASKLENELATLQSQYSKAKELLEEEGDAGTSRMKGAGRLLSKIDEVKQELKDLKRSQPRNLSLARQALPH